MVSRLDVSVQHPQSMGCLQRLRHLRPYLQHTCAAKSSGLFQVRGKSRACKKLHREKDDLAALILGALQIEGAADVGVGDAARQRDLPPKPVQHLRVCGDLRQNDLERNDRLQLPVIRFIDRPHAAFGDEPAYLKPFAEHRTWRNAGQLSGHQPGIAVPVQTGENGASGKPGTGLRVGLQHALHLGSKLRIPRGLGVDIGPTLAGLQLQGVIEDAADDLPSLAFHR